MKKVAFCISSFRAGGGEKQVIEIANAFASRGYEVHLLVLKPVGQYENQVGRGVRVISLDAGRIVFSLPKLVAYLRREQPEALLALDEYTHLMSLMARMVSRARTRIILREGNMLTELFKRYASIKDRLLIPFLVRRLYKKADIIVANSKGVADDVAAVSGIKKEKVVVIYNPKDLALIRELAKSEVDHPWLTDKKLPIVIAVGRLRIQKNFPLLIRAFARATEKIPARLIVVGGGREERRLRELVASIGAEYKIALVGYSDNPYAWMEKADFYVAASLWEGLPNSLLEAMASGLPVIASDCSSGPREVLAPDTDYRFRLEKGIECAKYGILTAVGDEEALSSAITLLLKDERLRETYRNSSLERITAFDRAGRIDEYERALGF